jgi:CHASE3 domain sensor protein
MKKDKQRTQRAQQKALEKAQLKANRKQAEKAVKATLITELTTLVSTFAEPNKKLKKLIEKAASAFAKEIDKTAKPVVEALATKTEEAAPVAKEKKAAKPRTVKKTEKEATK